MSGVTDDLRALLLAALAAYVTPSGTRVGDHAARELLAEHENRIRCAFWEAAGAAAKGAGTTRSEVMREALRKLVEDQVGYRDG